MRRNFGDPDEVAAKPFDRYLFYRLMGYVKPFARSLVFAALFMLLASVTELAGPYILKIVIDKYIIPKNVSGLWQVVLIYSLILVVNWVATYYNTYLSTLNGQRITFTLRQHLFEHLQTLSFGFFDRRKAGKIMSRLTNDINALNQFFTSGILNVASDLIILCGIIGLMLSMSWKLALVTFLTLPLIVFTAAGMRVRVMGAFRETRNKIAEVNSSLQENISGVRVVQAFTREGTNLLNFERINQENYKANLRAATLLAVFVPMVEMTAALGTVLVIWYGSRLVLAGEVTVGVLAAFLGFVTRFYSPIRDLSTVWGTLQSAMASSERLFEILDTHSDIVEGDRTLDSENVQGEVTFEEVSFSYDGENKVLEEISLTAHPGQRIALVGPTGAGKTSIINLIGRFYEPDSGQVLIDGVNIGKLNFKSLRSIVGVVLQDTFIFAGTVRENIAFGCPEATQEQIERVSKLTGAHEFIVKLPEGYDSQVQERGVKLSTGQRQLLAFARALLANPRILILDEATSSIDVQSEQEIQRAIDLVMKGRTCFIVAHRLSTIREADRILVIDEGRIVEEGKHEELLSKRGMYRRLYLNQFKEVEEEKESLHWRSPGEDSWGGRL
ncbi:MAG TPA: ABC transporter ATP-binding protein [Candidatus Deferrimicrobium sp.]|nr:ABC transporter ATP-binding protein [Candidatus Deferrimicrobium sp.]